MKHELLHQKVVASCVKVLSMLSSSVHGTNVSVCERKEVIKTPRKHEILFFVWLLLIGSKSLIPVYASHTKPLCDKPLRLTSRLVGMDVLADENRLPRAVATLSHGVLGFVLLKRV